MKINILSWKKWIAVIVDGKTVFEGSKMPGYELSDLLDKLGHEVEYKYLEEHDEEQDDKDL